MFVLIKYTVYRKAWIKGEKFDEYYEKESTGIYENMSSNSWRLLTLICQYWPNHFTYFFIHLINTAAQWKRCYFGIPYFM